MKKCTLLLSAFILAVFCSTQGRAQNLVINGSGEASPHDTARPAAWVNVLGTWFSTADSDSFEDPEDGNCIFVEGDDSAGILQQDVAVASYAATIDSGHQKFFFSGWEQSYAQDPPDVGAFYVQCLDATKTVVLRNYYSDTMSFENTWGKVTDSFYAPANTRFVRIQLVAIRYTGSDNDAYFDNIVLTTHRSTLAVETMPSLQSEVTIYPVPAQSSVVVALPAAIGRCDMRVVNMQGQTVRMLAGSGNVHINVQDLPNGNYMLLLNSNAGEVHKKFCVIH